MSTGPDPRSSTPGSRPVDRSRRRWLTATASLAMTGLLGGCASAEIGGRRPHVVVVGGGYGGAMVAKLLRTWSNGTVDVTLVEPERTFVSCPLSNLVLGGSMSLAQLTLPYTALTARHGVRLVHDRVARIDRDRRTVTLAAGDTLRYDALVLSPGVDLLYDRIEHARAAHDDGRVLHAWRAGPETVALRRQLEAMPDGGTFAITVPEVPYRCPPGPYERACQVASYFQTAKPRSKVLILDANPDVTSKGALFKRAWKELYPGMVEHRPQHEVQAVIAGLPGSPSTLHFAVQDDVRADVVNLLPPMAAGAIAVQSGLATSNGRWCGVDFLTFASVVDPHVHVLGDAVQSAAGMPKSAHMANGHAKVCAAALLAQFDQAPADQAPVLVNTCYSHVDARAAVHVSSVHAYDAAGHTYTPVSGAGGLSDTWSAQEGDDGHAWARSIWQDTLG